MSHVSEDKIEVIKVELSRDDITAACIEFARLVIKNNPVRFATIDEVWAPQVTDDGYGGRTLFFRKKVEPRSGSAQLTGTPLAQVGR